VNAVCQGQETLSAHDHYNKRYSEGILGVGDSIKPSRGMNFSIALALRIWHLGIA
jgi:hypothetical protein